MEYQIEITFAKHSDFRQPQVSETVRSLEEVAPTYPPRGTTSIFDFKLIYTR